MFNNICKFLEDTPERGEILDTILGIFNYNEYCIKE